MLIIAICLFALFFGELTFGWSRNPKKKFYRRLLQSNIYAFVFAFSVLLCLIPFYNILKKQEIIYIIFFMPCIYLILFRVVDLISIYVNNRHIIIATRWDQIPKERNWKDVVLTLFAFIGSFALTILIKLKL